MKIIRKIRRQKATYWALAGGKVDEFGVPVLAEPVEIDCRWSTYIVAMVDAKGESYFTRSKVHTDREVRPGDVLWYGLLADFVPGTDPRTLDNAGEVRNFKATPDIKNRDTLFTAFL